MGDVVELNVATSLPIPTDKICKAAAEESLDQVLVIGYTQDGELYVASSTGEARDILWLIEQSKQFLVNQFLNR